MSAVRDRVTPATKRPYTAGHFELQIDGHATTAYLKSIDGGHVSAALIDEPIGPENMRIKHMSTVDIEPISVELLRRIDFLAPVVPSLEGESARGTGHAPDGLLEELEAREAFGRAAEPWEIATVMVFLASEYSTYMTGEVVAVSSQHP